MKIKKARKNFELLGTRYPVAAGIITEKVRIAGVTCYWFRKQEYKQDGRLLLYLHGGCFVLGSVITFRPFLSQLASHLDMPVLFIEYRLAPEHPFPAAIEDILRVYQVIIQEKKFPGISFMGDSAGAGLAVSVISFLHREKRRLPRRLVMLSPWIDLRLESDSHWLLASGDPILAREQLEFYSTLYLGNRQLEEANPAGMLEGEFPPALILAGSREILLDDSRLAFAKISASQPATKLKVYEGQTHDWPLEDIHTEASADALNEIREFLLSV